MPWLAAAYERESLIAAASRAWLDRLCPPHAIEATRRRHHAIEATRRRRRAAAVASMA